MRASKENAGRRIPPSPVGKGDRGLGQNEEKVLIL